MPSRKIEDLDVRFQPFVQKAMVLWNAPENGSMDVRITCTQRSWAEQDEDYAKGRTAPGEPCTHEEVWRPVGTCKVHPLGLSVTAAVGGMSWHNYGIAIDVAPFIAGKPAWSYKKGGIWDRIADLGRSVGMEWGGTWRKPDRPHFEWHPGYKTTGIRIVKGKWEAGERPIQLNA